MLFPNQISYCPKKGPVRLGGTWVEVKDVAAEDAPVVLERTDRYGHEKRYRSYAGRLWEVQRTAEPNATQFPEAEMTPRWSTSLPAIHQLPHAQVAHWGQFEGKKSSNRDTVDDHPDFLASSAFARLHAVAKDRIAIDGVMFRASFGPLVRDMRSVLDPWDLARPAALTAFSTMHVEHQMDWPDAYNAGRIVQHGELPPRIDLLPMKVECAMWYLLLQCRRTRLHSMPRQALDAQIAVRSFLEERRDFFRDIAQQPADATLPIDDYVRTWDPIEPEMIDRLRTLADWAYPTGSTRASMLALCDRAEAAFTNAPVAAPELDAFVL